MISYYNVLQHHIIYRVNPCEPFASIDDAPRGAERWREHHLAGGWPLGADSGRPLSGGRQKPARVDPIRALVRSTAVIRIPGRRERRQERASPRLSKRAGEEGPAAAQSCSRKISPRLRAMQAGGFGAPCAASRQSTSSSAPQIATTCNPIWAIRIAM